MSSPTYNERKRYLLNLIKKVSKFIRNVEEEVNSDRLTIDAIREYTSKLAKVDNEVVHPGEFGGGYTSKAKTQRKNING